MLTTNEVAYLIGASYKQLYYWASKGACLPAGSGEGSGSRMIWPPAEIRVAQVLLLYANLVGGTPSVRLDLAAAVRSASPEGLSLLIGADQVMVVLPGALAFQVANLGGSAVVLTVPALSRPDPSHVATQGVG